MELTPASLKQLCKDLKLYSSAPELNDVLHLQHKGINRLQNLEAYTGLKTLYLECNAIADIEGLESLVNLRCLYLGKNIIHEISGLDTLTQLESLDLSDNDLHQIQGLDTLPRLKNLNLSGNKLESAEDVQQLQHCTSLITLDLSQNRLDAEDAVHLVTKLPLALLKLNGNPIVSHMRSYRKAVVAAMPGLHHLDDMPVTDKERRLAVAFMQGGLEAERAERTAVMQEEEQHKEQQRQNFNDMVEAARAEAAQHPPPPHDPMRFRAVLPGESESDEDDATAMSNSDKQALQEPSVANTSDGTITAGSTSTAQPFTDAVAYFDDIDTDDMAESRPSGTQSHDIQTSQTSATANDDSIDKMRPSLSPAAEEQRDLQSAAFAHQPENEQQGHVQAPPSNDTAVVSGQSVSHTRQGHSQLQPASQADFQHQERTQASRSNDTAMASGQSQHHGRSQASPSNDAPVASGQSLAGNLAFQQELQQRSGQRQARAGAMSDATIKERTSQRNESERGLREQARPAVWGTPQYGDLWQQALTVGEQQEAAQAAAPAPEDLIQSATYPEEQAGAQGLGFSSRVSPDYAQSYGRGHEGMDIDSAVAHRIPRGNDSAAESDASSLSDYDDTADPMDRFSVTALPASQQHNPFDSWRSQNQQPSHQHHHDPQQQSPQHQHQQQQQQSLGQHDEQYRQRQSQPQQQLPQQPQQWQGQQHQQAPLQQQHQQYLEHGDDSAHDGRLLVEQHDAVSPGASAARPDLAAMRGRDDSARTMPGVGGVRPDLGRSSGHFERTDSASDLPQDAISGQSEGSPLTGASFQRVSPSSANNARVRRDSAVESLTLARQAMNESRGQPSPLSRAGTSLVNQGASTSSGITAEMLEEPQRQDSALHPLLQARRAVLQDLANNPSRPSATVAIPRAVGSSPGDELAPAGRTDSARDARAVARGVSRGSGGGASDSSAPSGSAHWPEQGGAQPSTSSPAALTGEASSGTWGPQAGAGGLHGEASTTTGYGPPLLDNPSETLEEARRLLASSLQAEPSTSSGFSGPSTSGSGLTRTTSRTLEEARRLVLGTGPEAVQGPPHWHETSGQGSQGLHAEMGFSLQRDSAQHPLVEARRTVLEDLARHPSNASELAAGSSETSAAVMRQQSLQRDSPLQPILLARQAVRDQGSSQGLEGADVEGFTPRSDDSAIQGL